MGVLSKSPGSAATYRDPIRPALIGFAAMLAFLFMFAAWGHVAPLSSAAIASGSLQVQGQRQSVQHPFGGVIARLLVSEGQHVERDQPLIELDRLASQADFEIANAEVVALLAQQARLVCERDGGGTDCLTRLGTESTTAPEMEEAIENERAVMLARKHQYEAEKGMLTSKVAQLHERILGLSAQVEGLGKQSASLSDELGGTRKLLASGFTSRTRVLELERAAAQLLADQGSRKAEIASAKQQIDEAELAVARLERERVSSVAEQIKMTRAALAEASPKLETARNVMERTIIRAPVAGSIVDLSVFTEGGVIQAGMRLMDIVPDGNPIIVEARLPLSEINGIAPGVTADIRLTGVPRADRPRLRGEVISVSADKVSDSQTGVSYFGIRVSLDPEDVRQAKVQLRPGMPAEVIISNGTRTLGEYLLAPLLDEVTRALREE